MGINFAELEGKGITDYAGMNMGILGTARLSKHTQAGLEILFSQNGEYILPEYYPIAQYGKIRLNHIEVPVHFDWLIDLKKNESLYNLNLNIGLAYTRLLGYHVENSEKEDLTDQVVYGRRDALLLQIGSSYNIKKNIAFNFKASLPLRREGLNWTLGARLIYLFKA